MPATINDLHRPQLQAIGKMAKAEERPRVWATMADFQTLAGHRVHWAWARVFFAVGMAFTLPTITTTPWSYQEGQTLSVSYSKKIQGNKMQPHKQAPMETDGASMLPGAKGIPTSPYHMGQVAHPETGSPLCSTPTGMENARQSAPPETYGEYRALHEKLRVAVDAGPRPLACGRICVG